MIKASVLKPLVTTVEQRLVLGKLGALQPDDRSLLSDLLARMLGV